MTAVAYGALWIFIFVLPWENVVVIPGLGTISRLMGMLSLGIVMLAVVVSGRLRRWHAFHIASMLFVMWLGLGLLVFHHANKMPLKYGTFIQLFLVLWMIWELAQSRQAVFGLLLAFVLGSCVASLNTIMVFRSAAETARRFSAQGFDPNDLAMTLALALPLAWYLGMHYRNPVLRWVCRGYLPLGLLGIALSGSRGGILAAMVGLLILPATMTRLTPARLISALMLLLLSGTVALVYTPESLLERLATTGSELESGDFNGRLRIWKAGLRALSEEPVHGVGIGAFPLVVQPILGAPRASHNSFIGVLVEHGIVGLIIFLAIFASVFVALLELPTQDRRFGLIVLATLVMAMLPLGWEDQKTPWFILAALLGLAQSRPQQSDRRVSAPKARVAPLRGPPHPARPGSPLSSPVARRTGLDAAP